MSDKLELQNHALFSAHFEDGSIFVSGNSYDDTKWLQLPHKQIKKIYYALPNGDHLCLEGYEKYFHMLEATKDLNGPRAGMRRIEYAYIMGKRGNIVVSYRITLFHKKNDKYKVGDIVKREFHIHDKFVKGLNPSNWR